MNIFAIFLIILFMGVYYYTTQSPNTIVKEQETEYAIKNSDLRSVTECVSAVHNAKIQGTVFEDVCVEQNGINSDVLCFGKNFSKTDCSSISTAKTSNYVITTTAPIPKSEYNNILNILEKYYADSGTFGIFMDNYVISGSTFSKQRVPSALISDTHLENGQLIYLSQFDFSDSTKTFADPGADDIVCPSWSTKTYRFGRWQCINYNLKENCTGDMIWDSSLSECVPDTSRKPLCATTQTAIMVDGVWQCINPIPERKCSGNMVARLNYNTLEWECVEDPSEVKKSTKCKNIIGAYAISPIGTTLRVKKDTTCTECEKSILDEETCVSTCIPDPNKITGSMCYFAIEPSCNDETHGIYFGFPSTMYAANVTDVVLKEVPLSDEYLQDRNFHCKYCPNGIDYTKSNAPYTTICK